MAVVSPAEHQVILKGISWETYDACWRSMPS